MANAITIGRLVLLYIVIWLIYTGSTGVITACMFLLVLVFAGDGLDGWVARRQGTTSTFGAVFDIAGDRMVENSLWVIFAHLGLIPVWIPLLVLGRGFVVDGLRSISFGEGMTAFGEKNMMRSALTQWLTAGRFMRALFGYMKAAAFVFLCGLVAWETKDTSGTALGSLYGVQGFRWFGWALVWGAVALTVIRGLPVLWDAIPYMREIDRRKREGIA
ncbi:MAG TPA: CDP-alcohol phosphatidyltransferase family protein [Thermomicrobiales bacterium]|nr:CDP-alcohol phosphatidyltransferase family protein [Thermomicrobiales bacterium]